MLPPELTEAFDAHITATRALLTKLTNAATVASLMMSTESVFSAIFGFLILHETLTSRQLLGCVLVFAAVIVAQLPQKRAAQ